MIRYWLAALRPQALKVVAAAKRRRIKRRAKRTGDDVLPWSSATTVSTVRLPWWWATLAALGSAICALSTWTQWIPGMLAGIMCGAIVIITYINARRALTR